jgi:DNA-binding CsgD family transcriptional regulator
MLAGLQPLLASDEVSCSIVNPTIGEVIGSWGYPTRTIDLPQAARVWRTRPSDHPWMIHYARTSSDRTFLVSDLYSGPRLRKLEYYTDFYKPKHVRYAGYSVITHTGKTMVGVGLGRWRTDFTDRERDLFEHLRRPLGSLWQLAVAREGLARSLDTRARGPEPRPLLGSDALEALTAGEREVVWLVAQGWTNRRIAYTLRVSVKAVEQHLTHVFRKVGVSSRTQLVLRLMPADGRPELG